MRVVGRRENGFNARRAAGFENRLMVGRDRNAGGLRAAGGFSDAHDHGLPENVLQGLLGKARRLHARRNDDGEAHE